MASSTARKRHGALAAATGNGALAAHSSGSKGGGSPLRPHGSYNAGALTVACVPHPRAMGGEQTAKHVLVPALALPTMALSLYIALARRRLSPAAVLFPYVALTTFIFSLRGGLPRVPLGLALSAISALWCIGIVAPLAALACALLGRQRRRHGLANRLVVCSAWLPAVAICARTNPETLSALPRLLVRVFWDPPLLIAAQLASRLLGVRLLRRGGAPHRLAPRRSAPHVTPLDCAARVRTLPPWRSRPRPHRLAGRRGGAEGLRSRYRAVQPLR